MSSAASMIAGSGAEGAVQIAMLKKAQTAEASSASQLVQNLPPPPKAASPAGVGGQVDFTA